jgi:hypothetical protein
MRLELVRVMEKDAEHKALYVAGEGYAIRLFTGDAGGISDKERRE